MQTPILQHARIIYIVHVYTLMSMYTVRESVYIYAASITTQLASSFPVYRVQS